MPADPAIAGGRAAALAKMTIHDGEFKKGLALMEQSVAEFPLALAYRTWQFIGTLNLNFVKGSEYTQKLSPSIRKILTTWSSQRCSCPRPATVTRRSRSRVKT
jgi:hypothetical protein